MGVNYLAALNSDLNSDFVPKTISDFLSDLSDIDDISEKVEKLNHFVHLLEDEIRKIQVFQRELPLSMLLLTDAVTKLKEETMRCMERRLQPAMKGNSDDDGGVKGSIDNNEKKNWMSSVQLWTNSTDQYENSDHIKEQPLLSPMDSRSNMTNRGSDFLLPTNGEPALIMHEKQFLNKIEEINSQKRKQRRCWSTELHRNFIHALQQLGGAQVATPKLIKELMQVEDLTNDEIKSHLQKYRLHVRKVVTASSAPASDLSWLAKNNYYSQVSNPKNAQSWSPEGPLQYLSGSSANKGVSISIGDQEDEDMTSLKSMARI